MIVHKHREFGRAGARLAVVEYHVALVLRPAEVHAFGALDREEIEFFKSTLPYVGDGDAIAVE